MSLVALDWMMQRAEARGGLRLLAGDRAFYREHANVDDKLYDPRKGTGILYRWAPRVMAAICRKHGVPPLLHLSVLERIAHGTGDYSPGNIAPPARVVVTETADPEENAALLARAHDVERVLDGSHHDGSNHDGERLLARVRGEIFAGRVAYYVYLVPGTWALVTACARPEDGSRMNPLVLLRGLWAVFAGLAGLHAGPLIESVRRLVTSPELLGVLAGGHLASWLIAVYTERRMSAVFSVFWHDRQQRLREALKTARETAARAVRGRVRAS
jgi:hypothetical protein